MSDIANVLRYQGKVVSGKIQSPRCLNKAAGRSLDGQMRYEPVEVPLDDEKVLDRALTFLRGFCAKEGCYVRVWVPGQLRTVGLPEFEQWLSRRGATSGEDEFAQLVAGEVTATFRSPTPEPEGEPETEPEEAGLPDV